MASETIIATSDSYLDEDNDSSPRNTIDNLQYRPAGAAELNPIFEFDVSDMDGRSWDSVVLNLTFHTTTGDLSSMTVNLGYVTKAVVMDQTIWSLYATGLSWATAGAETDDDNDATTRESTGTISGVNAVGDTLTSPDITGIVQKAIDDNAGTLFLIMYGAAPDTLIRFKSLEFSGILEAEKPQLVFSNVQVSSSADTGVTSTDLTTAESAALNTQSARPPVSEPGRQTTVSVLADGVEPMTILSLIVKAEYGTDA